MTEDLRKKGGRPRAIEPGSKVSTWLPAREHDRLIQEAARRGASVSEVLRAAIRRGFVTTKLPGR